MAALEQFKLAERLTTVAPLGLRFRDDVSGKIIGTGLNVTA